MQYNSTPDVNTPRNTIRMRLATSFVEYAVLGIVIKGYKMFEWLYWRYIREGLVQALFTLTSKKVKYKFKVREDIK